MVEPVCEIPVDLPLVVIGRLAISAHELGLTLNDYILDHVLLPKANQVIRDAAADGRAVIGDDGAVQAIRLYQIVSCHDAEATLGVSIWDDALIKSAALLQDRLLAGYEHLTTDRTGWRLALWPNDASKMDESRNSDGVYPSPVDVWLIFGD